MPSARRWNAKQLIRAWIFIPAVFFALRWILLRIDGALINWPPAFPGVSAIISGGAVLAVLGWLTATWFGGRNERHVAAVLNQAASRRILR
ncbi:MAG: hypothetical protein AAF389_15950 [Gemmatimonadota bacterium]